MTETSTSPSLAWTENAQTCTAHWRSERGAPAPKRVQLADDTLPADTAYRLACEGTGLLWRGDFQNARHLLQALARRLDKPPARSKKNALPASIGADASDADRAAAFHRHRQTQAHRARVLGMVLVQLDANYGIALRRAPDVRLACKQTWGAAQADTPASVVSLRELLGVISAFEWRKNGLEVPALTELTEASAPNARHGADAEPAAPRIHPHYGVFSPQRGEYVALVAQADWPLANGGRAPSLAFDIGTGTGVLAAVLARRGVARVVATELQPRALQCAQDNIKQLGLARQVEVLQADLFPPGQADVVVCNPPWLPARPGSSLEAAVYDEGGAMLSGFLQGLNAHLTPGGEGWLILSDLAEHVGLRSRAELLAAFRAAGLQVLERIDARPEHPRASDATDPLHAARAAEVTSLWRLAPMDAAPAP